MSSTKSLIGCPPKVLIRWSASWITKTTRIREGMAGVRTPQSAGVDVVVRLKYLGLTVDWPVLKFDGRQCDVGFHIDLLP